MEYNYAYITLLSTNNYIYGCIGLIESWKRTKPKYPFYCMVTPDITDENKIILQKIGYHIIEISPYCPKKYWEILKTGNISGNSNLNSDTGWQFAWSKLLILQQEQFDKLIFLDVDMFILQNLDHLFEYENFTGVQDLYFSTFKKKRWILTALWVVKPNREIFDEITQFAEEHPWTGDYLNSDMDIINLYVNYEQHPWLILPSYYLIESTRFHQDFSNYIWQNYQNIKIVHLSHYVKPWQCKESFYKQCNETEWQYWSWIHRSYTVFLKKCLEKLHHQGIDIKPW